MFTQSRLFDEGDHVSVMNVKKRPPCWWFPTYPTIIVWVPFMSSHHVSSTSSLDSCWILHQFFPLIFFISAFLDSSIISSVTRWCSSTPRCLENDLLLILQKFNDISPKLSLTFLLIFSLTQVDILLSSVFILFLFAGANLHLLSMLHRLSMIRPLKRLTGDT